MPVDETPTPADAAMPVGARIMFFRKRSGKSRAVLGGLVGKSASWVKAIETGRLLPPRLPVLVRIAEVLNVRDLADLTGGQQVPVDQFTGPGHAALPAVRRAITVPPLVPDGPPPDLAHLRARLDTAWRVRHSSPNHRTAIADFLPDLIRDAGVASRLHEGLARREAYAILAQVMGLAQMYLAYQPDGNLLWRTAERGLMAAQESGRPDVIAAAVWFSCQIHRDSGQWDDARAVVSEALDMLTPRMPDADTETHSLYGALCFEAAYTAARVGEAGEAWRMWDRAEQAAERLPEGHYHRQTSFSRIILGAHAVTTAVELQQPGEARRFARRTSATAIPSAPRRARHLIEVARAHHLRGDHVGALTTLEAAQTSAPETVRYNGYARIMTLELQDASAILRPRAQSLALAVGLLD